jgi:hypothetical protein
MTAEEPAAASSSSSKILDTIESGILCEKKERKEERKERNEEEIEAFKLRRPSMKTGRAENKMREEKESNLATTREIIYLRKPGLEARPGPPAPSAEPWPSSSTSPASPSTTSVSTP